MPSTSSVIADGNMHPLSIKPIAIPLKAADVECKVNIRSLKFIRSSIEDSVDSAAVLLLKEFVWKG